MKMWKMALDCIHSNEHLWFNHCKQCNCHSGCWIDDITAPCGLTCNMQLNQTSQHRKLKSVSGTEKTCTVECWTLESRLKRSIWVSRSWFNIHVHRFQSKPRPPLFVLLDSCQLRVAAASCLSPLAFKIQPNKIKLSWFRARHFFGNAILHVIWAASKSDDLIWVTHLASELTIRMALLTTIVLEDCLFPEAAAPSTAAAAFSSLAFLRCMI